MNKRHIVIEIARRIFEAVAPRLGGAQTGDIVGESKSGDFTFALDEVAEKQLEEAVADVNRRAELRLAFYSEDRGLVSPVPDPQYALVVDPIDGTRPAICGLESCCVSVALGCLRDGHTRFRDLEAACLIELKSGHVISAEPGRVYLARRIDGPEEQIDGSRMSKKTDLSRMHWAFEQCARPVKATARILGDLIDASSFAGGAFIFNSSSYAISRVVVGQLDAYIDPYVALLRGPDGDQWEAYSRSLYGGRVFGLFPYDIAAAAYIAKEAGAVVCDVKGESLDNIALTQSSIDSLLSCLVASNRPLADTLLAHLVQRL